MSAFESLYYPPLEPPPPGIEPTWWPVNAAQQKARNSTAQLLLFGGGSGGGKTSFLAADAMDEFWHPRLRALIIRTTLEEQQELEDIQQRMYEPKGARWLKKRWRFPSGATIRPGYLAHDKHLNRYQGNPYSYLGIDESGQHPEHRIRFMIGWLAAPMDSGLRVRGRFTCNPGGIGMGWEMKVFLRNRCPVHYPADSADDRQWETSVYPGRVYSGSSWTDDSPVHKTTAFIPARLADNPLYGREKLESLLSQSKAIQQQLLYGCWCNAAGLYFDFMRPDMVVPYQTIGDSWWWQHLWAIDFGYGNSAAAAGMYAINPNGVMFRTRERVERKMPALEFAKRLCKTGFPATSYPSQGPQENWLKKLKVRDPEKPRMAFCVMDEAMDQHRGTGKSVYDVMSDVFTEYGIGCIKAAHDPAGNAQVLYNGLANEGLIFTRDSIDLSLGYRAVSSRIVDERKAVKKIHGAWEDDVYDECVAKGTLVATEHGDVRIEDVMVGDKVWTRSGLQRVTWAGVTGVNKSAVELITCDGRCLTLTPNHVINANGTWVTVDSTNYGDYLEVWDEEKDCAKKSPTTGNSIGDIRSTQTSGSGTISVTTKSRQQSLPCTVKFGKMLTDQFRRAWLFITRMATASTTTYPTSKLWTPTLTESITTGKCRSAGEKRHGAIDRREHVMLGTRAGRVVPPIVREHWQTTESDIFGIEPPRGLSAKTVAATTLPLILEETCTALMPAIRRTEDEPVLTTSGVRVQCAESDMPRTDISLRVPVRDHVLTVREAKRIDVYNLSVENAQEFFANGILVHNCSYAYNTWRQNSEKPARTALQEELEQLRKDGMDSTSLARIAWIREQALQKRDKEQSKGIRLSRSLTVPSR